MLGHRISRACSTWPDPGRARYLAAVEDRDRLLRLPIEDVRAELGMSPPEPYSPLELGEVSRRWAGQAG